MIQSHKQFRSLGPTFLRELGQGAPRRRGLKSCLADSLGEELLESR